MSRIETTFQRLPRSTNSWSCRWFLTVLYASSVLLVAALFALPSWSGWVGLTVALGTLITVLVTRRRGSQSCST